MTANTNIRILLRALPLLCLALAGCGGNKGADDMQNAADPFQNLPPLEMKQGGTMGSLGLNLETYFAPDIRDPVERAKRLERALIALHKDVQVLAPSVQHLSGLEPEIEEAITGPATQTPENLLAAKPVAGTPAAAATPADGKPLITAVRAGEHPDMVRIVFDVTQKTAYRVDLDNTENLLVVEIPDARWQGAASKSFGNMPVLKSWKVDPFNDRKGQIFVVQLKGPTSIAAQGKYPGISGSGERIVIDLKK